MRHVGRKILLGLILGFSLSLAGCDDEPCDVYCHTNSECPIGYICAYEARGYERCIPSECATCGTGLGCRVSDAPALAGGCRFSDCM